MKLIVYLIAFSFAIAGEAQANYRENLFSVWLKKSPGTNQPLEVWPKDVDCNSIFRSAVKIPEDLLKKAESGTIEAQIEVATLYIESAACSELESGISWLKRAAENGSTVAANELGYGYIYGAYSLEKNLRQAKKWLQIGVDGNDEYATYNMAQLYRDESDDEQLSIWLKKAADMGMPPAVFEYAFRCNEGLGVELDAASSCKKYIDKARSSKYQIGDYINHTLRFYNGRIAPVKWLLDEEFLASKSDDIEQIPSAIFLMAASLGDLANTVLSKGKQHETDAYTAVVDPDVAFNYSINLYHVAAQLGSPDAQRMMQTIYQNMKWENASKEIAEYWKSRLDNNRNH